MADPTNAQAAKPAASTDSPEEMGFISSLKRLLQKHDKTPGDAQNHALGGLHREKTVMDAVDEAVSGAKDAPRDY